jgi:hypothetical protein
VQISLSIVSKLTLVWVLSNTAEKSLPYEYFSMQNAIFYNNIDKRLSQNQFQNLKYFCEFSLPQILHFDQSLNLLSGGNGGNFAASVVGRVRD